MGGFRIWMRDGPMRRGSPLSGWEPSPPGWKGAHLERDDPHPEGDLSHLDRGGRGQDGAVQSQHDPEDPCLPAPRRERYHRRGRSPGSARRSRETLRRGLAPWHAQRSLLLAARRHALQPEVLDYLKAENAYYE